ncbi:hypothetical protein J437_LFUL012706 [Ladona fulva]|uniref:Carbohydrate sulfotransferase n=1 Tax=Ladona fulva TaxID=123851 RepID=A0A8K0P6B6_LADFU|nr:hypothetical protein J437_LFUL012706 [Ladona fulva]
MGRWESADLLCLWRQRRWRSRGAYKLMGAAAAATCILLYLLAVSAPSTWDTPIQQLITPQEDDVWSIAEARLRMREARLEMDQRLRRVEEVCRRYNLGLYRQSSEPPSVKHPPTPQYSVFYIDKPHKISWCPIYKAASSTWLYNFLLLGGMKEGSLKKPKEQLSVLARKMYPEPEYKDAEEAFGTTFKFMVVRHPFERLLSAYRDKLENSKVGLEHGVLHFYQKYGRHIVEKYRFNRTIGEKGDFKDRIEPTFPEFVRYLIDEDLVTRSDDHWIPFYLFCTPCLLRYDAIAKVETMRRDQEYILRSAALLGVEGIKPRWRHQTRGGKTTDDMAKSYFSQLSEKQVLALYHKYSLDFDLFGYSPQKYLEYARNG